MTIETGNTDLNTILHKSLLSLASGSKKQAELIGADSQLREAAFHDFSSYEFVFEPQYEQFLGSGPGPSGTTIPPAALKAFKTFSSRFDTTIEKHLSAWIKKEGKLMALGGYSSDRPSVDVQDEEVLSALFSDAKKGFRAGMAPALFVLYVATSKQEALLTAAFTALGKWLDVALVKIKGQDGKYSHSELFSIGYAPFWAKGVATVSAALSGFPAATGEGKEFGDDLPSSYPFDPFAPSVNFGLQIMYRQAWVPLGAQPGEVVRTLPLGPKQSEKISVKVIRRTKATRQTEIATSSETATEGSAATKDSSEVVQEASEKFNWHVEASASASYAFVNASIKSGMGGANASASKDAKSLLNETMEKTASKIRRDTKVVVSTEIEETSERTQMSEITNPNDELAVTYIYSRLQRQYELRTYLSEVNQVVFVAEPVPSPDEITGPWIRRYDWIIARELLDDSFRPDLEVVQEYQSPADDVDARIQSLMESLSGDGTTEPAGIPDYQKLAGEIPDLFENQQAAYERELERKRTQEAEYQRYRRSLSRLRAHVYDNILHYCRAIWSAEDPAARTLRYQKIQVPVRWELAANSSDPKSVSGYFVPAVTTLADDTAPLADLVNPAGPIGYAGNYAVFYLRRSTRWDTLSQMISIVQAPYLAYRTEIKNDTTAEAVDIRIAVSDNITQPGRFRCKYSVDESGQSIVSVDELRDDNSWVFVERFYVREGAPFAFGPVRLWITGVAALSAGDTFQIAVSAQQSLEDPELKALRWRIPPLADGTEATFFTAAVIDRMREYFSVIYSTFDGTESGTSWQGCSPAQQALLVKHYHDYLLRASHTRRIVLDTNNLILTREVDSNTTLEPFKGLHRVLDVLKAGEDVREASLENERKRLRLDADQYGDPDVEKLTVVAATPGAANLAPLDGLLDDDDGETEEPTDENPE